MARKAFIGSLVKNPEFPSCEICGSYKYISVFGISWDEEGNPCFEYVVEKEIYYTHECNNCGAKYMFKLKDISDD